MTFQHSIFGHVGRTLVSVAAAAVLLVACQPEKPPEEEGPGASSEKNQRGNQSRADEVTEPAEDPPSPDLSASEATPSAEVIPRLWCAEDGWCWERTQGFDAIAGMAGTVLTAYTPEDESAAWAAGENVLLRFQDGVWSAEDPPHEGGVFDLVVSEGQLLSLGDDGRVDALKDGEWIQLQAGNPAMEMRREAGALQHGTILSATEAWGATLGTEGHLDILRWTPEGWASVPVPNDSSTGMLWPIARHDGKTFVTMDLLEGKDAMQAVWAWQSVGEKEGWSEPMLAEKGIDQFLKSGDALFAVGRGVFRYNDDDGTWEEVLTSDKGVRFEHMWGTPSELYLASRDMKLAQGQVQRWDGNTWETLQTDNECILEHLVSEGWHLENQVLMLPPTPAAGGRCLAQAEDVRPVADLQGAWTDGKAAVVVGENGTILRQTAKTDGTWETVESPTEADLYDLWGSDEGLVAVGELATITRTKSPERGWRLDPPPEAAGKVGIHLAVWGLGNGTLLTSGEAGTWYFDGSEWTPDDSLHGDAVWGTGDTAWVGRLNTVHPRGAPSTNRLTIGGGHAITALWGRGPDDVYATARGQLHHFDGKGWTDDSPILNEGVADWRSVTGNGDETLIVGPVEAGGLSVASAIHRISFDGPNTVIIPGIALLDVWVADNGDSVAVGRDGSLLRRRPTEAPD